MERLRTVDALHVGVHVAARWNEAPELRMALPRLAELPAEHRGPEGPLGLLRGFRYVERDVQPPHRADVTRIRQGVRHGGDVPIVVDQIDPTSRLATFIRHTESVADPHVPGAPVLGERRPTVVE